MHNESSFTLLGSGIQRKTLKITFAIMTAGLGNDHRLPLAPAHKTLDAYALERLQAGLKISEVQQELTHVCDRLADSNTYKAMVQAVDGQFPLTAVGILQRKYGFSLPEGRLAVFLLQLSCRRRLIAELVEAEVVPTEEVA